MCSRTTRQSEQSRAHRVHEPTQVRCGRTVFLVLTHTEIRSPWCEQVLNLLIVSARACVALRGGRWQVQCGVEHVSATHAGNNT